MTITSTEIESYGTPTLPYAKAISEWEQVNDCLVKFRVTTFKEILIIGVGNDKSKRSA